jgi:hypothetical protein
MFLAPDKDEIDKTHIIQYKKNYCHDIEQDVQQRLVLCSAMHDLTVWQQCVFPKQEPLCNEVQRNGD